MSAVRLLLSITFQLQGSIECCLITSPHHIGQHYCFKLLSANDNAAPVLLCIPAKNLLRINYSDVFMSLCIFFIYLFIYLFLIILA